MKKRFLAIVFISVIIFGSGCGYSDVMEKMNGSDENEPAKWDTTYWDQCNWL